MIYEDKIRKWEEESKRIREYIIKNKSKFIMYKGRYIESTKGGFRVYEIRAIAVTLINNDDVYIVDSDTNKFELARRIGQRFTSQDKFVLISTLDEILNSRTGEMPSSEFAEKR